MAKENISKIKREPIVWENIFGNDTSDKGLISKIYKELSIKDTWTKPMGCCVGLRVGGGDGWGG